MSWLVQTKAPLRDNTHKKLHVGGADTDGHHTLHACSSLRCRCKAICLQQDSGALHAFFLAPEFCSY